MVAIEKLSKSFPLPNGEAIAAVHDATLHVEDRELLALVGPSGSGKTSILRLMAGLDQPSSGTIQIDGRIVNDLPPQDRNVSMVFQESSLYPHMTVRQNLAFGLKLRKFKPEEIARRVSEAADLLGLTPMLARLPKALSGGERQRVSLGRAIVLSPSAFLLDEPFSNLDAPLRAQLRRELVKLHRRLGATMIYVTHDQMEAMTLAQRIAVLHNGTVAQTGTPQEIYRQPATLFVARFFGVPPMNCFAGSLIEQQNSLWFRPVGPSETVAWLIEGGTSGHKLPAAAIGREIILGLRPEHIRPLPGHEACRPPEVSLTATVEFLEPLGYETHLYFTTAAGLCTARVVPDSRAVPGDSIRVALNLPHAHFFLAETGDRIC